MSSKGFTNGQTFVVEDSDLKLKWGGSTNGERFRCGICGLRFTAGSVVRWIFDNDRYSSGYGNFFACAQCDGPDVRDKRRAMVEELKAMKDRFWWAL